MEAEENTPSQRLFFALWPDDSARTGLAAWQPSLRELCGGRVMRSDTLHITLVFMGEVRESRLEELCLAAQEVDFQSFDLNLTEAHYWGHNHIVYATPETMPPSLAELVVGLEQSLRKHRFHIEQRAYKPHVSLLRNAKWDDGLLPRMPAVHWRIEQFVLVQSLRTAEGPLYRILAHFGV